MPYTYQYPHPAVTVDTLIFTLHEGDLKVLLIQRKRDPHAGAWALPGGFVEIDEDLDTAARRELAEETGLQTEFVEQLHTFGAPGRDPRERVISVAYFALVRMEEVVVKAASDARDARWFPVQKLPKLAFDHAAILKIASTRLRERAQTSLIVQGLLPKRFSLQQLREAIEAVCQQSVEPRSFKSRFLDSGTLSGAAGDGLKKGGKSQNVLYRFDRRKYERMSQAGEIQALRLEGHNRKGR